MLTIIPHILAWPEYLDLRRYVRYMPKEQVFLQVNDWSCYFGCLDQWIIPGCHDNTTLLSVASRPGFYISVLWANAQLLLFGSFSIQACSGFPLSLYKIWQIIVCSSQAQSYPSLTTSSRNCSHLPFKQYKLSVSSKASYLLHRVANGLTRSTQTEIHSPAFASSSPYWHLQLRRTNLNTCLSYEKYLNSRFLVGPLEPWKQSAER